MSSGIDLQKAEAALKRAARRAIHGTRDERAGRLVSSALTDARYNAQSRDLDVWFVSGRRYRYSNVPPEIYEGLLAADSKGIFFNAYIRDNYAYRELAT
jgi:lysyl-tRNA synthetase class 2